MKTKVWTLCPFLELGTKHLWKELQRQSLELRQKDGPPRHSSAKYAARDMSSAVLVSSYCCSTYRVTVPFSSLGTFCSFSIGDPVFHLIDDCEHPLLYLPGTGIASQETAISGSLQQNLAGICNSVWVWWLIMGWIPGWDSLWIVHPFVLAPNFVSVTP